MMRKYLSALLLCLLMLCGAAQAQESTPLLTLDDIIRLSEKGEALTAADFESYDGKVYGMYESSIRYLTAEGYTLEIDTQLSMMRLFYPQINRCCIDIRYFDVEEFVNSEDKSKYILFNRKMTEQDLMMLSKLGDSLREEHFMHFDDSGGYLEYGYEGEVDFWSDFTPIEGYILHLGKDPSGTLLQAWLMKADAPEYHIDIRNGDIAAFVESTRQIPQKPCMTIADVISLSQKGASLSLSDLSAYSAEYEIYDSISASYPIEDGYVLNVYAADWQRQPDSINLSLAGEYSPYIDIRLEDVNEFIGAEDKSRYVDGSRRLNREDVLALTKLDDVLLNKSLSRYAPDGLFSHIFGYEGESDVLCQFVIDDTFSLLLGSGSNRYFDFVWVALNAEPEVYADLRSDDVQAFFDRYDTQQQFSGQLSPNTVRYIQQVGKLMLPISFESLGAKDIAAAEGFCVYRYEVGDSHILLVSLCTCAPHGPKNAYLISRDNEDEFTDIWQSEENVLNILSPQEISESSAESDRIG